MHGIRHEILIHFFYSTGVVDSSGFRVWVTPTLREHDAHILSTGIMVQGEYEHIIPPYFSELTHRGFCTEDCINDQWCKSLHALNFY